MKRHPALHRVGPRPVALVLADLTGDGRPEIITANRGHLTDPNEEVPANDEATVLVAGEDLRYSYFDQLKTGFAPYDIEAVNVDGQRALDLVIVSFMPTDGPDLSIFRNTVDRDSSKGKFRPHHFAAPTESLKYHRQRYSDDTPLFTVPGFTSVAVARLDEDEFRDAVATGWSSDVLAFFRGTPDTYFSDPVFFDAPGGPFDVQIADFDKDEHLDLVTTQYSSGEIAIWRGDGEGAFEIANRFPSGGDLPHRVRVADLDADGWLDLVVSHRYTDDNVVIWYGEDELRFNRLVKLEAGADRAELEHDIRDIALGDFDANGRLDVAAACPVSGQCIVWLQELHAGAPAPSFRAEPYPFKETEGEPYALAADDVDGDGDMDLGVALWRSNTVTFLLSTANDEK